MKLTFFALATAITLGGCSSLPNDVLHGTERDCGYIGCEDGGLVFYHFTGYYKHPCNFGIDGSQAARTHEEYRERRAREIECNRSHGLDPIGAPMVRQK
jgi:hypothetical protein